jgi:murein DD-endopeptidase MepM/ murein hydrolase activator NlpD
MRRVAALILMGAAAMLVAAGDPKTENEHVVTEGETLNGIAARAGVASAAIAAANGLKDPFVVRIGQKLTIPRQKTHVVAKGDTGFGIAIQYGVPFEQIAAANGLDPDAKLKPGQKLAIPAVTEAPRQPAAQVAKPAADPRFRRPVDGAVLLGWQRRADGRGHEGLDFAADIGDRVGAAAAGRVIFAGDEPNRFGRLVVIDHGNDWYTAYGNLSKVTVKRGEQVRAGERIGLAGDAGDADRPEVHFEIRKDKKPVDPAPLLGIDNGG